MGPATGSRARSTGDITAAVTLDAYLTLEDETSLVETVWFPTAYRTYGPHLDQQMPLRVAGQVDVTYGVATLTVQRAEVVEPTP